MSFCLTWAAHRLWCMKNGLNLCHDSWITSGSKPVSKEIWNQSKTYSKDELSQCFAAAEVQKSTPNFPQPPSAPCLSKQQDESSRGESGWHARPRWKEMFGASILLLGNCCCSVVGKLLLLRRREAVRRCDVVPAMSHGLRGRLSPAFMWWVWTRVDGNDAARPGD